MECLVLDPKIHLRKYGGYVQAWQQTFREHPPPRPQVLCALRIIWHSSLKCGTPPRQ